MLYQNRIPAKVFLLVVALALLAFPALANAQNDGAERASAILKNSAGEIIGFAFFTEDARGLVHVNVHVKGISPGQHGIHIHAVGMCTPDFLAARGHYNPLGKEHGLDSPAGPHAGDLPNLTVNEDGVGHLNAKTDRVTVSPGPTTLFDTDGSALIIHAMPDDQLTQPIGGSGARIACGIIERA